MKKYEIMYILKANLEDADRNQLIGKLHELLVLDGGTIEIAAPGLTISGDEVATKLDIDCKIDDLKTMIEDKSSCFEANDNYILNEIDKLKIGLADLREELKAQQTYEVIHGFKKLF